MLRTMLPSLVIDGLCPFLAYTLLKQYVPTMSDTTALIISGIFPAANGLIGIIRRRHLDIIAAIVLLGIIVSVIASLIGGDPKVLLIRESFVTGALGVACLASLLLPRPLLFYIGRQFSTNHDPVKIEHFNSLWQYPRVRRLFRFMTIVWGIGWVSEFLLRVLMVETLSIAQVLAISPFVFNGITLGLIAWTLYMARRARQSQQSAQAPPAA